MLGDASLSEGAPIPLLRRLRHHLHLLPLLPSNHPRRTRISGRLTGRRRGPASRARAATMASCLAPLLEVRVAVLASTALDALRVEACVLVERDLALRVAGAEDVTAAAAVVTAGEEAEGDGAGGVVAFGRRGVGLEKGC